MSGPHRFVLRVYYEDTDMAGIVYYANYLRYIERARSEWVRALGLDQRAMKEQEGVVFVVRRIEADYLAPAYLEDDLTVETAPLEARRASLRLSQSVLRGGDLLFRSQVTLAALNATGRPTRLPKVMLGP